MSTSVPRAPDTSPPGASLYGLYILSLGVCGMGNLAVRIGAESGWLPGWAQIAVGLASALPLVITAGMFWRLLGDLDEMMQRIALEGLALALVVYVPLAAIYVNARTAGAWMPRLDPPDLLFAPALLVAIGIALAKRRYQ